MTFMICCVLDMKKPLRITVILDSKRCHTRQGRSELQSYLTVSSLKWVCHFQCDFFLVCSWCGANCADTSTGGRGGWRKVAPLLGKGASSGRRRWERFSCSQLVDWKLPVMPRSQRVSSQSVLGLVNWFASAWIFAVLFLWTHLLVVLPYVIPYCVHCGMCLVWF